MHKRQTSILFQTSMLRDAICQTKMVKVYTPFPILAYVRDYPRKHEFLTIKGRQLPSVPLLYMKSIAKKKHLIWSNITCESYERKIIQTRTSCHILNDSKSPILLEKKDLLFARDFLSGHFCKALLTIGKQWMAKVKLKRAITFFKSESASLESVFI